MYCYESHLGGIYWTDRELSLDERSCEECGDCDVYICFAANRQEALELIDEWTHPYKYYDDKELTQEDKEWCNVKPKYLQELIQQVKELFND